MVRGYTLHYISFLSKTKSLCSYLYFAISKSNFSFCKSNFDLSNLFWISKVFKMLSETLDCCILNWFYRLCGRWLVNNYFWHFSYCWHFYNIWHISYCYCWWGYFHNIWDIASFLTVTIGEGTSIIFGSFLTVGVGTSIVFDSLTYSLT